MKNVILLLIIIVILGSAYLISRNSFTLNNSPQDIPTSVSSPQISLAPSSDLAAPTTKFKERITKKPFGIYITPEDSPIQPERFTGYHTGVDVEYEDVAADVPIYAVSDGTVVLSRTASGYGGVIIIEIKVSGNQHTVLYGHIRPSSLPSIGQKVLKGEQMGVLGTAFSAETGGERKHLHFAVLSDSRIDLKGYVQNKSELSGWIDPVTLY